MFKFLIKKAENVQGQLGFPIWFSLIVSVSLPKLDKILETMSLVLNWW